MSTTPSPAATIVPHSIATRPKRSIRVVPAKRPAVIAITKTAKPATPTACDTSCPSTRATASQSLAVPSVVASASTITPMSSVRGSSQARAAEVRCSAWVSTIGRKLGEVSHTTTRASATTATRCSTAGTASSTSRAPSSAPTTVPPLNPAWKRGMIVRPSPRSTSAPSTFMATSQTPMPTP